MLRAYLDRAFSLSIYAYFRSKILPQIVVLTIYHLFFSLTTPIFFNPILWQSNFLMNQKKNLVQKSGFSSRHPSSRAIDVSKEKKSVSIENFEMSKPAISYGELLDLPAGIDRNLTEVLLKTAKQDSTKGITYIQSDEVKFQSYFELKETATKILTGLKQLGLKPKDKVILQLERNQDFIEAFWACILGGFVPVPLATAPIYEPDNSAAKKLHTAWQNLDKV